MSVTCRFPYALLQQIQNDLATLKHTVDTLQTQSNSDDALLHILQDTVHSIGLVLSGQDNTTTTRYMNSLFTDCTEGTLSYLDDNGNTHDLEHTLDSKLTMGNVVTPAYYASNRNITLGCDSPNDAYIHFHSNDSDTSNTLYDCKILSHREPVGQKGRGSSHYTVLKPLLGVI